MLQQETAQDFVIATGEQYSVRDFILRCASLLDMELTWTGSGVEEKALDAHGNVVIGIEPRYFRPTEVESLLGDAAKARRELGWTPRTSFDELVREMIAADLEVAKRDALVKEHGFEAFNVRET